MKASAKLGLAAVLLSAIASQGCIITSAQVLAHFELPNPFTINSVSSQSELVPVDLSVDPGSDYTDNKDKLQGLTDLAILGTFTNVSGPAGAVEVYIVPTLDGPAGGSPSIPSGATLLWGPAAIGASGTPGGTRTITWDESAALFNPAGKAILLSEALGDGQFTIYTTGTGGNYEIQVKDGVVVLVLDAGN